MPHPLAPQLAQAEQDRQYYRMLAYERARERELRYQQGLISSYSLGSTAADAYYEPSLAMGSAAYSGWTGLTTPLNNYHQGGPTFYRNSSVYSRYY